MGKIIEINDKLRDKIKKSQQEKDNSEDPGSVTILQMTAFDNENNPHKVNVGITRLGDFVNYPLDELPEIIEKLNKTGLSLKKH